MTCGGAIQNRSRVCIGPKHGGENCSGAWDESRECGTIPCPGIVTLNVTFSCRKCSRYGSETHLREVPIYVKSRIVTS